MSNNHPNLVFVFPDQMRGSALGFLNEEPVRTPHLDQLASESLVLTQAASNYPVCRASATPACSQAAKGRARPLRCIYGWILRARPKDAVACGRIAIRSCFPARPAKTP